MMGTKSFRAMLSHTSRRRNTAWIQETYDMVPRLRLERTGQESLSALKHYLWALGPTIGPIQTTTNENFRTHPFSDRRGYNHMGLGAANHFSSPSHYILGFLKHVSTADARLSIPSAFWYSAQAGNLSYVDLHRLTKACNKETGQYRFVPLTSQDSRITQFVVDHLPWAVRQYPDRYPWLYGEDIFETEVLLHDCICYAKHCDDPRLQ
eukprot:scaffold26564_cov214-Amphora_coffeaeformis.AAC.1